MNVADQSNQLPDAVHRFWRDERLRLFKFSEEVTTLLRSLNLKGYKLAIITNGPADVQRPKLKACNASAYFGDHIVVSGEQPEWKPHASIFNTALNMLGVERGE